MDRAFDIDSNFALVLYRKSLSHIIFWFLFLLSQRNSLEKYEKRPRSNLLHSHKKFFASLLSFVSIQSIQLSGLKKNIVILLYYNHLCANASSVKKDSYVEPSCCKKRQKKVPTKKLVCGIGDVWRFWMVPNWSYSRLRNRRTPLNKCSPWNIWRKQ